MTTSVLDVLPEVSGWDASEASTDTIYRGEGTSLSERYRRRKQRNPQYEARLVEAAKLYRDVLSGDRYAALVMQEALSTSDFSNLFGDILDRQILVKYQQAPVQWDMLARRGTVRDFRTVKRFTLDGGEATLSEVKQLAEYPAAKLVDAAYSYAVKKYGRRIPMSWETLINDDLDLFRDLPARLGNAARRSEERFATDLYAGTTGPDTTFFSTANKNVINTTTAGSGAPTNPALTVTNLQYAFQVLAQQLDTDGAPIYVDAVTLVVPPALEVVANNIINATQIIAGAGSGGLSTDAGRADQLMVANWMARRVRVVVNPWLPLISTTNGNTSWYLFANPSVGRPAIEMGFLMGHEQPELFQKAPNAVRVGGGSVSPEDGDFDADVVEWKLRHVFGGTLLDPKSAVGSNGTGS